MKKPLKINQPTARQEYKTDADKIVKAVNSNPIHWVDFIKALKQVFKHHYKLVIKKDASLEEKYVVRRQKTVFHDLVEGVEERVTNVMGMQLDSGAMKTKHQKYQEYLSYLHNMCDFEAPLKVVSEDDFIFLRDIDSMGVDDVKYVYSLFSGFRKELDIVCEVFYRLILKSKRNAILPENVAYEEIVISFFAILQKILKIIDERNAK